MVGGQEESAAGSLTDIRDTRHCFGPSTKSSYFPLECMLHADSAYAAPLAVLTTVTTLDQSDRERCGALRAWRQQRSPACDP